MKITLDIETIPTTDPAVIAEMAASITAPAQYKKADSIADWLAENHALALKEKIAKTSFDGMLGRIACIACAFDDGPVFSAHSINGEKELLEQFYEHIVNWSGVSHHTGNAELGMTFIGHNIAGFDLPFLKHRSIILGVRPPNQLLAAMNAKAWDKCIADTMLMWSSDREKRVSLDKLCKALGIPGKGDFDGSMVAETWPVDPDKVIAYCRGDVERTRQIYKRLTFE